LCTAVIAKDQCQQEQVDKGLHKFWGIETGYTNIYLFGLFEKLRAEYNRQKIKPGAGPDIFSHHTGFSIIKKMY
jgi:hypothetical protein